MNILEKFLDQGFSFRSFPAYGRHIGVEKYHCVALLELVDETKLKQFSSAGYLLDEEGIALLVERQGRSFFVYKSKEVVADGELLEKYQRFLDELKAILAEQGETAGSDSSRTHG